MARHVKGSERHVPKRHQKARRRNPLPRELVPAADAPVIKTPHGRFDLEDPILPDWLKAAAPTSGGYPYDDEMKAKQYEVELPLLQIELVKLQHHVNTKGLRIVALFEGRDAAGKGGSIFAIRQNLNPRSARDVALPKPNEREAGQWYFQRYVEHLPTKGEIVLFDRSWYNRAGVEPVMGFCTPEQAHDFLIQAPGFEKMIVHDGILFFKFWLEIGREMQLLQFHQRRHDPLKVWKLSPIDYAAMQKWDAYTAARDRMLAATDLKHAPWTVVLANDKRRARLALIRHLLSVIDYAGKDRKAIGRPDPAIAGSSRLVLT
jgi:polyphosphate kinase 2